MPEDSTEQNKPPENQASLPAASDGQKPEVEVSQLRPLSVTTSKESQENSIHNPVNFSSSGRKSNFILATITLVSFCVVAFSYLLFIYLGSLADKGMSGTEFIALALWPVLATVPFLSVIGLITGIILIFKSPLNRSRIFWGILSLLFLLAVIHQAVGYFAESKRSDEYNRILGRDETVSLISNCEIESFHKNLIIGDNAVDLQYKNNYDQNDEWQWKPNKADENYYPDYVTAAKNAKSKCGEITYSNDTPGEQNDPASQGHRWIGMDEAKQVLLDCEIKTFNYGPISLPETLEGPNSGIALIDYGWVKHLYVYPQFESQLLPIVTQAKAKCGAATPQIWNGSYE